MSKKKTHEEYEIELSIKNPKIKSVGKYIDAKTKITHYCLVHDVNFETTPDNTLHGSGCPQCRVDKIKISKQKTNEEYINELSIKNPNVETIENYIDANTKILHRCKLHDFTWLTSPQNVLKGGGCSLCKSEKIKSRNSRTHEQYVNDLNIINPNIIPLEQYITSITPILHKCLVDNYEWKAQPNNLLNSRCGCPKCSQRFRRNKDDYINELQEKYPNIVAMEEFQGMRTPIMHLCIKHNVKWKTAPENILNGCGCSECKKEKLHEKNTMSYEEYTMRLNKINPNIIITGKYINATTKTEHKCLLCNNYWFIKPSYVLQEIECPGCTPVSKGEYKISEWLDSHNIQYETQYKFQDCKDKRELPFDFYIPSCNKLIEYDGRQHFEPIEFFGGQESFEIRQKHDKIKNEYCKNNGISLLRIPYYKNVEEELNNFLFI